jgi:serine/threonine protein kinase
MLLEKHKSFTPEIIAHLVACVLSGLQFIHLKLNAIHRNVSLENIYLDEEGYFGIDNYENIKILESK